MGQGEVPLLVAPRKRLFNWWLAGVIIPVLISLMFAYLLLTSWNQPAGQSFFATASSRFMTFGGVVEMLQNTGLLAATWLDNLTTGMLFGAWMTRRAERTELPRASLWPLWLSVGAGVTFIGGMFTPWAFVWGAALSTVALTGWFWPRPPHKPLHWEQP